MRRREFITLLGGTVLSPFAAHAQQNLPTIGFLNGTSAEKYAPYIASFYAGLKEGGFVEGENVAIEYRWADGDYSRLPALAAASTRTTPPAPKRFRLRSRKRPTISDCIFTFCAPVPNGISRRL